MKTFLALALLVILFSCSEPEETAPASSPYIAPKNDSLPVRQITPTTIPQKPAPLNK